MTGRRFSGRRSNSGLKMQASVKTQKHLLPPMSTYPEGQERASQRVRSQHRGNELHVDQNLTNISEQRLESSRLYVRKFSDLGTEPAMVVNNGMPLRSGVGSSQPSVTIVNQRMADSLDRERRSSLGRGSTNSPTVAATHMHSIDASFPQSHFAQGLQRAHQLPRSLSNEKYAGNTDRSSHEKSDRLSNILHGHKNPISPEGADPSLSVRHILMEKLSQPMPPVRQSAGNICIAE